ncbi:hypothetical protein J6590_005783 [Homalodisca vitripennis]|nr:hypothetical protein J6590_005783 [Homalodisca vitripennis]
MAPLSRDNEEKSHRRPINTNVWGVGRHLCIGLLLDCKPPHECFSEGSVVVVLPRRYNCPFQQFCTVTCSITVAGVEHRRGECVTRESKRGEKGRKSNKRRGQRRGKNGLGPSA